MELSTAGVNDNKAKPKATVPLKSFTKAVKALWRNKKYTPELLQHPAVVRLVKDTHKVYAAAIEEGFSLEDNQVPQAMAQSLDHDAFMFSGFKVHHQLSEVGLNLRDSSGRVKSFDQFKQDTLSAYKTYNTNYLQAEYQYAVTASQMAAKWVDVEEGGERYNLQYRTAGDGRVREAHVSLHNVTLPSSDPFWDSYYPPNGWRCRCTAVQVRKGKHEISDSQKAKIAGEKATTQLDRFGNNKGAIFRFNPGKDNKVFPPKHPYLPKGCGDCSRAEAKLSYDPQSEKCKVCMAVAKAATKQHKQISPEEKDAIYKKDLSEQYFPIYKNRATGFEVRQHLFVNVDETDYSQVLATAKAYTNGMNCYINPVVDRKAVAARKKIYPGIYTNSNPDLRTDKHGYIDVKSPKTPNNIIRNANDACSQGCIAVVTDLALREELRNKTVHETTEAIFSEKNKNDKGERNYTKPEVHWFVKGKLLKFNKPKEK